MGRNSFLTRFGSRPDEPSPTQRAVRLLLAALLVLPQAVVPAVITVDGTDSTVAADGVCSLIEAIKAANTDTASGAMPGECIAGSGADTVRLTDNVTLTAAAYSGFQSLKRGLPLITSDVTIDGGFTIARDGSAPAFGIFEVSTGGTLNLNDTTVSGGGYVTFGGGIIHYKGTLTLNNSTLSGNDARYGGGIFQFQYADALTVEAAAYTLAPRST